MSSTIGWRLTVGVSGSIYLQHKGFSLDGLDTEALCSDSDAFMFFTLFPIH